MTITHASTGEPGGALAGGVPWARALAALDASLFDCVQVNLAVLAHLWRGGDAHLALGARAGFRPVAGLPPTPGPHVLPTIERPARDLPTIERAACDLPTIERAACDLPTIERPARDLLREAEESLGFTMTGDDEQVPGDTVARHAAGGPVLLIADAFFLPWVPYAGHRHMEHGFLLADTGGTLTVVDGYHNETPWGPARPLARPIAPDALAAVLPGGARVVRPRPDDTWTPPVARFDAAGAAVIDAYVDAYRDHPHRAAALDRLTLETWLLSRSRRLHAAYRTAGGEAEAAHLRDWAALCERTFLAARRVQQGRPEPDGLFDRLRDVLAADTRVFGGTNADVQLVGGTDVDAQVFGGTDVNVRAAVVSAVTGVLGTPPATDTLTGLPGFSSFRAAEIVERLEADLGVELDPDDLVPETLHSIEGLARATRRARDDTPASAHATGTTDTTRTETL
ncbi:hypothetical protein Skr01_63920 [Sphaerisporangium krabiense]|uniref:Acyl carrier protein n=1 Tax=Sphaerisporangium krabiense TaxID=763782 RepID=A0A7W8Z6L9_9ACTN|nr:acyl carrier protein [Sphaerisporangium krabiense]MBB5628310.1 acyl carrier protein [Sphaerisporangium krabiense]GII66307.1 hypothetical protein Skr01_63920 [Sphaerisporangium krabiense]